MSNKFIAAAMVAAGIIAAPAVQADDTGLMIRARAVYVSFDNAQNQGLGDVANALAGTTSGSTINANDRLIPEVDFSWFFTKNIATELVLTYPQTVNVQLNNTYIGKVKALPPSLVLQYHFTDLGGFKPYVGLGVNYTLFSSRDNISTPAGQVTLENSSIGMVGQVGFDYMFTKSLGLNVDVKYIQMETDVVLKASGTKVGALGLSPWTTGVGFTYKF